MKSKQAKKNYQSNRVTLMIIPDASARPWRKSFSANLARGIIAVVVLFAVAFALLGFVYLTNQSDYRNVQFIKEKSREKDKTIELLSREMEAIEEQQKVIEEKQRQVKKLMGIKGENRKAMIPSRGGVGGGESRVDLPGGQDTLTKGQTMKTALARQEKELDDMLARANNEVGYFRCMPNQWPVEGEITSAFGTRDSPFGGRSSSFHDGIDIANDVGTCVVSAGDGKVIFADWKPVYGKTILIAHGYGLVSKYSHNSAFIVKEGDTVKKGQPIARLGNTGRSTGPHLHFSILKNDEPQDPMIYLP